MCNPCIHCNGDEIFFLKVRFIGSLHQKQVEIRYPSKKYPGSTFQSYTAFLRFLCGET